MAEGRDGRSDRNDAGRARHLSMDGLILLIRCGTLEAFLEKIERSPDEASKLRIALEASRISDKIISMTPSATEECIRNLEHFSLAVFTDNLVWARESLENIRSTLV